jgi:hypothetical protein
MTDTSEVRRLPPLFFLSYAHVGGNHPGSPPREPNKEINQFFDDLSEDVSGLVSRPMGEDPGFLDRSVPYGSNWSDELLKVISTCQVFVALLSHPYLSSSWCMREWKTFSQRMAAVRNPAESAIAIIPVKWAPFPNEITPSAMRDAQIFSPNGLPNVDVTAQYHRYGVLGLMRTRQFDAYHGVVWQLAQWVADFHHTSKVNLLASGQEDLRDAFEENWP